MGPLFPKEVPLVSSLFTASGPPNHSAFVASQKQERETRTTCVKFSEMQKNEDPSLLTSLITSCFSKLRLLLTGAKEYKVKLCWPGKLLHRGGQLWAQGPAHVGKLPIANT